MDHSYLHLRSNNFVTGSSESKSMRAHIEILLLALGAFVVWLLIDDIKGG